MRVDDSKPPVVIDITDHAKAEKSLLDIFHATSLSEVEAVLSDDRAKRSFVNGWKPLSYSPVMFRGIHVTTSGNSCSDISEHGLLPLSDTLSNNTELARFVGSEFHFSVSVDKGRPVYLMNGRELDPMIDSSLLTKLEEDNRVNGYLFCANGVVDDYDKRPEVLEDFVRSIPYSQRARALQKWEETKKAFCVEFSAPFERVYQIEGIGELTSECEEEAAKAKEALLELILRVAKKEQEQPVTFSLRESYIVPPSDCKAVSFEDYFGKVASV